MMRGKTGLLVLATIALATVEITACGSTPIDDHYYSLVLAADEATPSEVNNNASPQLLVGSVRLPDYLDQRSIIMQFGSSRIQGANHHFWAEPLDEGIGKVLVQDIASINSSLSVDREFGRKAPGSDCRLDIEFDKFHATDDSTAVSSGRYWLSGNTHRVRREFDLTRRLYADGYGHAVDALRESLRSVAELISASIDASAVCTGVVDDSK